MGLSPHGTGCPVLTTVPVCPHREHPGLLPRLLYAEPGKPGSRCLELPSVGGRWACGTVLPPVSQVPPWERVPVALRVHHLLTQRHSTDFLLPLLPSPADARTSDKCSRSHLCRRLCFLRNPHWGTPHAHACPRSRGGAPRPLPPTPATPVLCRTSLTRSLAPSGEEGKDAEPRGLSRLPPSAPPPQLRGSPQAPSKPGSILVWLLPGPGASAQGW